MKRFIQSYSRVFLFSGVIGFASSLARVKNAVCAEHRIRHRSQIRRSARHSRELLFVSVFSSLWEISRPLRGSFTRSRDSTMNRLKETRDDSEGNLTLTKAESRSLQVCLSSRDALCQTQIIKGIHTEVPSSLAARRYRCVYARLSPRIVN